MDEYKHNYQTKQVRKVIDQTGFQGKFIEEKFLQTAQKERLLGIGGADATQCDLF